MLTSLRLLVIYAAAASAGLVFANHPTVVSGLNNTDLLLPAAYIQDLLQNAPSTALFQLPRNSSLVPDIALHLLLRLLFGDWRIVNLADAVLAFTAAVALGGAVVARAAKLDITTATAWCCAATVAALALDHAFIQGDPYNLIVAPAVHAGSLLLTFAGFALVWDRIARPSRALEAAIALLSLLAVLSDRMVVGSFTIPAILGLAAMAMLREMPWKAAGRIALVLLVGCAAGIQLDKLLFAHLMLREAGVPLDWRPFIPHAALLLRSPALPLLAALEATSILLAVLVAWRRRVGVFWVVIDLTATVGHLVLLVNLDAGDATTQAIQPVFWWSILWSAAAAAAFTGPARAGLGGAAALASVAAVVLLSKTPLTAQPAFLAWHDPIAQCLRPMLQAGEIHAGIAEYGVARPIEADTDWTMQVDPITRDGAVYQSGNNRYWYQHARQSPGAPPRTDFIVLSGLNQDRIENRFGKPDRIVQCPGSPVWIYAASIHRAIGGIATAAERDSVLRRDACVLPGDFQPLATAPLRPGQLSAGSWEESATQGPGTTVQKGHWRMITRYTLKGGDGRWELFGNRDKTYGTGLLPDTNGQPGSLSVEADLPRNVQGLYFRTFAAPGGRFTLQDFALQLPGSPRDPCLQ